MMNNWSQVLDGKTNTQILQLKKKIEHWIKIYQYVLNQRYPLRGSFQILCNPH